MKQMSFIDLLRQENKSPKNFHTGLLQSFFEDLEKDHGIILNDVQKQAVAHNKGQLLLLAVPGSGKTTTMILNIRQMIELEGIQPKRILAVTFSRESAKDMKERYKRFDKGEGMPNFSTIHSLAYRVMKSFQRTYKVQIKVLKEWEKEKLVAQAIKNVVGDIKKIADSSTVSEEDFTSHDILSEVMTAITFIKNRMFTREMVLEYITLECSINSMELVAIFNEYERLKSEMNIRGVDYDDMLLIAYQHLQTDEKIRKAIAKSFDYILTDESQDTSVVQHAIIHLLVKDHGNLFVVGDDDQGIYSWRGADVRLLLNFKERYPAAKTLFMEQNYRSSKDIVELSNDFIQLNTNRYEKNMFTENTHNGSITIVTRRGLFEKYADIVQRILASGEESYQESVVLFRVNGQELPLVHMLNKANIPFYQKTVERNVFKGYIFNDMRSLIEVAKEPLMKNYKKLFGIKGGLSLYVNYKQRQKIAELAKKYPHRNLFDSLKRIPRLFGTIQKYRLATIETAFEQLNKLETLYEKLLFIYHGEINYSQSLELFAEFLNRNVDREWTIAESLINISKDYENIEELEMYLDDLYDLAKHSKMNKDTGVNLLTMHGVKGLEFDHVYVLLPPSSKRIEELSEKEEDLIHLEEETRLHYVALSRAKKHLTIYPEVEDSPTRNQMLIEELLLGETAEKYTTYLNVRHQNEEKEIYCVDMRLPNTSKMIQSIPAYLLEGKENKETTFLCKNEYEKQMLFDLKAIIDEDPEEMEKGSNEENDEEIENYIDYETFSKVIMKHHKNISVIDDDR